MTDRAQQRQAAIEEFLNLLRHERRGDMWFGRTPDWYGPVVFGGVGLALTIGAACRDAPTGSRLHSLHAHFLRPVQGGREIAFRSDLMKSGRTFCLHLVTASQDGKPVITMTCSFTTDTDGYDVRFVWALTDVDVAGAELDQPRDRFRLVIDGRGCQVEMDSVLAHLLLRDRREVDPESGVISRHETGQTIGPVTRLPTQRTGPEARETERVVRIEADGPQSQCHLKPPSPPWEPECRLRLRTECKALAPCRRFRLRMESRSGTRWGDGPPVFVCHGGPNNICDTLIRDLAPLVATCMLVFHDYRGSGQSGRAGVDTYTFERLADDLDELRRHLGHETVAVLAHSMGGFVALQFALRHPGACNRLALVATSPCFAARPMVGPVLKALGPVRTAKALAVAASFLVLWSWRRPSAARTTAMYAPMSVTQEARPELRATVAAAHPELPVDNHNAPHLMKAFGSLDLRPQLNAITCPVLILYGSRDAVMVAGGQMLKAAISHNELHVLADVGHEPFIEAPAETFASLRAFLTADSG